LTERYVLDASALLVLLINEPGEERVRIALGTAIMGAVNCS
jgi:PIN domain nuclease of toxin-antitoxin system